MADYWKSIPKKYCEICRCWFADNKASIQFHENGLRHKENVKRKIAQIQRKGYKDFQQRQKMENEMARIEQAALKSFKGDVAKNPTLAQEYTSNVSLVKSFAQSSKEMPNFYQGCKMLENAQLGIKPPDPFAFSNDSKNKKGKKKKGKDKPKTWHTKPETAPSTDETRIWYEGQSEDGSKYYWNSTTQDSQWEPPEEGYISLEEQQLASSTETSQQNPTVDETASVDNSEPKRPVDLASLNPNPFGEWITVEKRVPKKVDLQLPAKPKDLVEVTIPLTKEDTFKIKEKTIGHLTEEDGAGLDCTFKKRRNLSDKKRNVRQRTDDT